MKVIISGGGTGGHIFPAISIANALKVADPSVQLLFVGAEGKMEMEKVPAAGYEIVGLPVAGFQRRLTFKNVTFFFKLAASMRKAKKVVRQFKPDVVVGVGGYASGPVLRVATANNIPTIIQEQNSYPGVTNKILSKKVSKICVAYPGMERFFPALKIILTGNPIRQNLLNRVGREEAAAYFGLDPNRKVVFVTGGSLGAGTINEGIQAGYGLLEKEGVQLIWQTGKYYYKKIKEAVPENKNIKIMAFVDRMEAAFSLADVVVSRAGASSISEIALLGKATVFVPSPNVSEDHQTKNAMALVKEDAAEMVRDGDVAEELVVKVLALLNDDGRLEMLKQHVKKFAMPDAAKVIVEELFKLVKK
ncbi:undecaprenyldiphospho-muramoylpentapeptide beta-N-acetylglucosaminyltransferase [Saccharicrinis fermentans]|uniref:UDP-N-acetylglucosamine--N-acetylmuramyl-(pentapeptide) pyrophosphoryl-undecaprenol N-acetylglucosamine transferase n=1 Tax=Saccharicrinis fermentans DSM 9555 = JCM 21142 TaxID=869213 RepID=W7YDW7_9BACT|nr:undecaprenyldiphospho-muramoylpentapeptide beta-N-acetylglucosaminyltransferase [Saccharicrinis fermentans]GAF02656.1 UDP-N-acetylglucosamine-N-acetylmuramyl-(pentapeptide) pyrophosphoryl-undecaprenol N-acetylglucosamine transferase [Saccharicrinis fermentans DSM 9555 = JCM 21142]